VSQSPERALRLQRYEEGWEIINRMIREETSWGGRERNCFHLGCGPGTFADISAASGLDFVDDGRAIAQLDIDRDGRPDLVLRGRTGPQLRILRNVWPHAGEALWIRLEGRHSNRDAIGARVTVRAASGLRVKEVAAGRSFLSQSSRWLCFGLGAEPEAPLIEVRWPGGRVEELGRLAPDRRWRVVEGEPPRPEPFAARAPASTGAGLAPRGAASSSVADDSGAVQAWLVEPLPAPDFAWSDASGRLHRLADFRGRPLAILFLSGDCPICVEELPELEKAARETAAAGGRTVFVSVDVGQPAREALRFLAAAAGAATCVRADAAGLTAWNLVHRHLFNWRRDLAVPTAFLLDGAGRIEKVYRGRLEGRPFAADIRRLPRTFEERLALALPFPGLLLRQTFRRDLLALGNAFAEAGLAGLARDAFGAALERQAGDLDSLFNYAVAVEAAGGFEEARAVYERLLAARPDFDDAANNLGILEARAGGLEAARARFRAVLERNPAHTEAALNLASSYLEDADARSAEQVYREALRQDPESAVLWRQLGYARYRLGDTAGAITLTLRALEIDPLDMDVLLNLAILQIAAGDPEAARKISERGLREAPEHAGLLNTLGMALKGLGDAGAAVHSLEQAIAAEPAFDRPYLNLARLHLERGDAARARRVLERLLEAQPQHEAAREMMRAAATE
jgi:tetratricopeptide (TPR) repeat protein